MYFNSNGEMFDWYTEVRDNETVLFITIFYFTIWLNIGADHTYDF